MPSFNFTPTDSFAPANALSDYASIVDAANKMQAGRLANQTAALGLDAAQMQNEFQHAVQPQQINGMLQSYKDYLQPQASNAGAAGHTNALASASNAPGAALPVSQFAQQLGASEGGNNSAAVNGRGYSGQFQFGAERLSDPSIGVYRPADGENVKANEWRGTFNIPGFPNVKTHDDFVHNPAAQRAVFGAHVADIDQAIAQTPGAEHLDPNGLRAVAHLGGVQGMQKFVATGGPYNPGDNPGAPGGGTHLSDYYQKFAEGGHQALQQAFGHPEGPLPPQQYAANGNVASDAPGFAGQALAAQVGVQPSYAAPQMQGGQTPQSAAEALGVARQARLGMSLGMFTPGGKGLDAAAKFQNSLDSMAKDGTVVGPNGVVMIPGALQGQTAITQAREQGKVGPEVQKANAIEQYKTDQAMLAHRANSAVDVGAAWQKPEKVGPGDTLGAASSYVAAANAPRPPVNALAGGAGGGLTPPPMSAAPGIFQSPGNRLMTVHDPDGREITIDPATRQVVRTPEGANARPDQQGAYKRDSEDVAEVAKAAQAAQAAMPRLNEMADISRTLASGAGGEGRAKAQAFVESMFGPGIASDFAKSITGISDPAAAQVFQKLNLTAAGAAAKADVGSNNGIGSITAYQAANPGLHLLPDANKRVGNMLRVANQATQDYAQAKMDNFRPKEAAFLAGKGYEPQTGFNQQHLAQNNPQVYAAATGILNGDPFEKWSAKLAGPDEAIRAAQIASRIDPTAMVPGRGGGMRPVADVLNHGRPGPR
jgi:hypothetical protein